MAPLPVILPLGALVQSFPVGPRNHNIALGFPSPEAYRQFNAPYFGETIGRYANRIAHAKFSANGKEYTLAANNGPNSLHGGRIGWGKREWSASHVQRADSSGAVRDATVYTLISPDGDEGYPGTVEARVYHWFDRQTIDGKDTTTLEVEYEARLVDDTVDETVVALTNHSYFNLTAGPTIAGTRVRMPSTLHLPVDASQIPLGSIEPFPGIPQDAEFELTATAPAIDHCMVLDTQPEVVPLDTRGAPLREQVTLHAPDTGVTLRVDSSEPAFQFYTGEGNAVPAGDGWPAYGARSGVAIEPSRYVNAVNVPAWRGQVLLRRGQTYGSRSRYVAWA